MHMLGHQGYLRRIEQFERIHGEQGLPITIQRRAIFEAMLERDDHPTADQVYETVQRRIPQISRMTVYRILTTFVQLKLITKICHPGSSARFDAMVAQHHHLVCLQCERIMDLAEERLNQVAWPDVRRYGFLIENYHIHFRGLCARCRRQSKRAMTGGTGTDGKGRLMKSTAQPLKKKTIR